MLKNEHPKKANDLPASATFPEAQERQHREQMDTRQTVELALGYWRTRVLGNPACDTREEHIVVLHMNASGEVFSHHVVPSDKLAERPLHAREVFRAPIEGEAEAVILVRTQTSGPADLFAPDIEAARHLRQAGKVLRIDVLDYILVRGQDHVSLRERGHLS